MMLISSKPSPHSAWWRCAEAQQPKRVLGYLCHLRGSDQLLLVIDCRTARDRAHLRAHVALEMLRSQASRCGSTGSPRLPNAYGVTTWAARMTSLQVAKCSCSQHGIDAHCQSTPATKKSRRHCRLMQAALPLAMCAWYAEMI